ncbi:WXG100 family type VII secretion target [Saccharopolyspora shandongensis]|uniref:WXG100 family type VII secretion target n=1 Tax=Saccharopolyspora shandongensis TaxID=418495 RepID=UPI00340FA20E
MAATDVSPGVQDLLEVLVGNDWPEGNPDDLRAMATSWRDGAELVNGAVDLVNKRAAQVALALQGETAESFRAFIAPFHPNPIPTSSEPPKLPETPKENWTAWSDETIEALNR